MPMIVKRETLHQIIETLPEYQLFELAKFVENMLSSKGARTSDFELWEKNIETGDDEPAEDTPVNLDEVIATIKNTPPNPQAISLPTKSWTDYATEVIQKKDASPDVAAWNRMWDSLEAEMEADSLTHEETERREHEA